MNNMIFTNAKLSNATFKSDVKLQGTTFYGADLTNCIFTGVDLEGVEIYKRFRI